MNLPEVMRPGAEGQTDVGPRGLKARNECLDQSRSFITAAARLDPVDSAHIIYHLALLALEEVGKASLITGRAATAGAMDTSWSDKALSNHRHKLQWAVWSPIERIDPKDFVEAKDFADRAHALRLRSLYVDADADLTEVPAREQVTRDDAIKALELAKARLLLEEERGFPSGERSATLDWFLRAIDDEKLKRQLFSSASIERYHALAGDVTAWIEWAQAEFARQNQEAAELMRAEVLRAPAERGESKPRWRATLTVYTPSHSLRPKALNAWNDKLSAARLEWTGNKDKFNLQLTLNDTTTINDVTGRATSLAKLVVACLNIGSIGYFWFQRPGFEHAMFNSLVDLEKPGSKLEVRSSARFWDDPRVVPLTDQNIDHAIDCMMAFAPLSDKEAAPIFQPYLDGLALIAKSDIFYSFDELARTAFVQSLAAAFRRYGDWDGTDQTFETAFHRNFSPIMPQEEHRLQMLRSLTLGGDPSETPLVNLRSAKQMADLYLILVGKREWQNTMACFADEGSSPTQG